MRNKEILIVIPTMLQGGAERVVSLISNFWAQKDNRITIISFDNQEPYYKLSPTVRFIKLNSTRKNYGVFNFVVNNINRCINYLVCVIRIKPQIIISFTDVANVYCILYNLVLRKPLIITQRTNPRFAKLPKVLNSFPRRIYRSADAIVVQTAETISIYQELNISLPEVVSVIYNPIHQDIFRDTDIGMRKNIVLAVGRLYNIDKKFDTLIDIFEGSANEGWELHIIGDGSDYDMLQAKIKSQNLEAKVKLLGNISDLAPFYQSAKVFAMTSHVEGFPNALCEAMANGCACISYNCSTGPSEIIRNGINGILVDTGNEEEYKQQLSSLMTNEQLILRFSAEAIKVREVLNESKIMKQWDQLAEKIIQLKS